MRLSRSFLLLATSLSLYASSFTLSMSVDTTQFDYTETRSNGTILDTETNSFGDIAGFTLFLEPTKSGFYLGGSYCEGETDYIGGTTSNPTYGSHRTTTYNTLVDYSGGYKQTLQLDNHLSVPLKVGLGYRAWLRDIKSTPSVSGYEELYDWGYYDVGIGLHFRDSSALSFGVDAAYRKAFHAQMYENWHGYTFDLNNVYGYKVSAPIEFKLDRQWSTFFTYTYEYWNIGASNVIGGYYEPDSETKNQILSLGMKYQF